MSYDLIVLGTGGVGSAALYQAARRGLRVLGIDRFPPGHDRGSSHGESRVIRMAYFEHADYVPLLRQAYSLWADVESATGRTLFHRVGLLEVGLPDGIVVPGVLTAAREHGLAVELLSPVEAARRFPGFHVPAGYDAVFEADAGYLLVEDCVRAHAALAQRHGAELAIGEEVVSWQVERDHVEVITNRVTYSAARLIITAGAWAGDFLGELGIELEVLRKHLHWYATRDDGYSRAALCPTYLYELPQGVFYGFPEMGEQAVKVGEHSGGEVVEDRLHDLRAVEPEDRQRVEEFLSLCLPRVTRNVVRHTTCFYTMSPDGHFVVDRHPTFPSVAFAAGLSGHGFKFTPALGQVLTELAIDGATKLPVAFLGIKRFST